MRRLLFLFACAIAIMTFLSACTASRLEADYGTSHKLAKFNQILNPDAEKNLETVEGVNGVVAQNVVEKYESGFTEKSTAPTFTFSLGSGK